MGNNSFIVIFVTTAGEAEAQKIANALVKQKKVACVNIIPKVNSLFWWQGKIESANESLLVIKSKMELLDEIIKLVKKLHSYEVPEIVALPIVGGNEDYLNWIEESLTSAKNKCI